MTLKLMRFWAGKLFCCGVIYFISISRITSSGCEVTLVTRNITDSFRIGKDGCKGNESVCTAREATCQDDGLCLCKHSSPHFRNPELITVDSTLKYGNSCGCLTQQYMNVRVGAAHCRFTPYKVIPAGYEEKPTGFVHDDIPSSCTFKSAQAKFPRNNTQINISWLNGSFVELNITETKLYFRWKKSVSELQGSLITMNLFCKKMSSSSHQCLRAKVLGTWQASEDNSPSSVQPYTSVITALSTDTTAIATTNPSLRYSSTEKLFSDEEESNQATIAAAVAVPLIVLIVVISLIWFWLKRRKGFSNRSISKQSVSYENNGNGLVNMGMWHQTGNDAPDKIETSLDIHSTSADISSQVRDSSNAEYAKPEIQRVEANGDMYAVVNHSQRRAKPENTVEAKELSYLDPGNLGFDGTKNAGQSSQPTEYADIVGVMQKVDP